MYSVFDIDDLEYLRINGLSLRHVDYTTGLHEQKNGANKGDAVSLANYGLDKNYCPETHFISIEDAINLQEKLEIFIFTSLKNHHNPFLRYTDAAFHLMLRGAMAQTPYDFSRYPLGKCGSAAFTPEQIVYTIFTNHYQNEDIIHATEQVFLEFKTKLRELKINAVRKHLLSVQQYETEETKKLAITLSHIIEIYCNNIYLKCPIFPIIALLLEGSSLSLQELTSLEQILASIGTEIKDESPRIYHYQEEQWDEYDNLTLKEKLLHYINNQNLLQVNRCLSRLTPSAFGTLDADTEYPLHHAASLPSTDILKTIYEFSSHLYSLSLDQKKYATPIYISFQHGNYEHITYLLSQRQLIPQDCHFSKKHIFANPPICYSENYFQSITSLLKQGADMGNEYTKYNNNPLAVCIQDSATRSFSAAQELLTYFLPLTDYRSKYLGLLSCSKELLNLYKHLRISSPMIQTEIEKFKQLRIIILDSLSLNECKQIRNNLVNTKKYAGDAENTLYNDFTQQPQSQTEKIKICFADMITQSQNKDHTSSLYRWFHVTNLTKSEFSETSVNSCSIL